MTRDDRGLIDKYFLATEAISGSLRKDVQNETVTHLVFLHHLRRIALKQRLAEAVGA